MKVLEVDGWTVRKIKADSRSRREFVWSVECPYDVPEPSWENDFMRGYRCRCRRFPTQGKAERYVGKKTGKVEGHGD